MNRDQIVVEKVKSRKCCSHDRSILRLAFLNVFYNVSLERCRNRSIEYFIM